VNIKTDILRALPHEGRSLVESMGLRHFHGTAKGRALNIRHAVLSGWIGDCLPPRGMLA
jgi:hypothetical protein